MAWAASNIARCQEKLHEYEQAKTTYEQALQHVADLTEPTQALLIKVGLAVCLAGAGEYRAALIRLERLTPALLQDGLYEAACSAIATSAKCHNELGNREHAAQDARTALKLVEQHQLSPRSRWASLTSLGIALLHDDVEAAISCFEEALLVARQIGNRREIASALHNTGIAAMAVEDMNLALERFHEAFDLACELQNPFGQAIIAGHIAETYLQRKPQDLEASLRWRELEAHQCRELNHQSALAHSLRELSFTRLFLILTDNEREDVPALVHTAIQEAAEAARVAAQLALVGELNPEAVTRLRTIADLSALAFTHIPPDDALADVWMVADASRGLAERVAYQRELTLGIAGARDPEAAMAAEDLATARQRVIELRASGSHADEQSENAIRDAEGRLSQLLFGASTQMLPGLADRDAFRADITAIVAGGDTALVTYLMTEAAVFALVATEQGMGWHQLDISPPALRFVCRLLHWSLAVSRRRAGANVLYGALVHRLLTWVGDRSLLIIPDGQLADLPWGALDPIPPASDVEQYEDGEHVDRLLQQRASLRACAADPQTPTPEDLDSQVRAIDLQIDSLTGPMRSGEEHRALFDDRIITVCSSVRTAAHLARRARELSRAKGLLAIADPIPADADGHIRRACTLAALSAGRSKPHDAAGLRLPHTRREVARAATLLGSSRYGSAPAETFLDDAFTILVGEDANLHRLRSILESTPDREYAALHFGAHGVIVDPGTPPPPDARDTGLEHAFPPQVAILLGDGEMLGALDMALLKTRAFVTTLFCCHSRIGSAPPLALDSGGLCASIHLAGAAHVVACTDAVPDESTAMLSDEFYSQLTAGTPPAAALAEAQRAVRDRYPDRPAAWAPFITSGPRPAFGLGRRRPQTGRGADAQVDVVGSTLPWRFTS